MTSCIDQLGRSILLEKNPQRIVSLVPSQTELLHSYGLDEQVIGITRFCIHPPHWHQQKQKVGGTKKLHLEKIASLQPQLIIANKEENTKADIEWLSERFPVWISDVMNLYDANNMMVKLGDICGVSKKAGSLVETISQNFEELEQHHRVKKNIRTVYLIWNDPIMVVGRDTFIDDMLHRMGLTNVCEASRYPELTEDQLKLLQPDLILLSSEPFPFAEKHIAEFRRILPNAKTILVDGEFFSWYGSRLKDSPNYFKNLIQSLA
ncbi:MAG: helical backbone metal receptor [Bacteroidota bacterium]|jgi:ABC-type Fe3+-hydroxamate transport system substrate-binding protein